MPAIFSQERKKLEKQKQKKEQEIEYTNELLKQTKESTQTSYQKLLLLNKKISSRKELITTINQEIKMVDSRIYDYQVVVNSLKSDLKKIKDEYARLIYNAYKHRDSYSIIMFILASGDFNQAYRRILYLKQFTNYRKEQAKLIQSTQEVLNDHLMKLGLQKAEKKSLLFEQQEARELLAQEKEMQTTAFYQLRQKQKQLKAKLIEQQKASRQLEKEIQRLIAEEAKKAAERAKGTGKFKLTPEQQIISDNFGKNKYRLPWPTERGIVTSQFGEHWHPVIDGVKIRNDGIDISTHKGAIIRSVFEGHVSKIFAIPGANKTVIIRHGNYLTVYSNLSKVFVEVGQHVKTKQSIGVVFTDPTEDNISILKFQIWDEQKKMNPETWLSKIN